MKKLLAIVLAVAMMLTVSVVAFAETVSGSFDVTSDGSYWTETNLSRDELIGDLDPDTVTITFNGGGSIWIGFNSPGGEWVKYESIDTLTISGSDIDFTDNYYFTVAVSTSDTETYTLTWTAVADGESSADAEEEETSEPEPVEEDAAEPETTSEENLMLIATQTSPATGVALCLVPMAIAALGAIVSKRK